LCQRVSSASRQMRSIGMTELQQLCLVLTTHYLCVRAGALLLYGDGSVDAMLTRLGVKSAFK
jgi:hypothetical protein